jgi:hypothetical protein
MQPGLYELADVACVILSQKRADLTEVCDQDDSCGRVHVIGSFIARP